MEMENIQILIVDLGSQYTLVIARTLRELGVRSIVLSPEKAADWLKNNRPKGIILSGGAASVYDEEAPFPPIRMLKLGAPILGICYGMQWLSYYFGGTVTAATSQKEYGETLVRLDTRDPLFAHIQQNLQRVWASHGDSITKLPTGFKEIASSTGGVIAGMSNTDRQIWGIQFHPEVTHTAAGKDILFRFLHPICGCRKDWNAQDVTEDIRQEARQVIGREKAVLGFSGGVDSSTIGAILSTVLGVNLLSVCIDTGALREGELEEIRENAKAAGVELEIIEAAEFFQQGMEGLIHGEPKREAFQRLYVAKLKEAAQRFGALVVIQGSLATDFIESGAVGKAAVIKTHHNIGGNLEAAPEGEIALQEWHPLKGLFKYEVRDLARAMGLPDRVSDRQPFPGPALFIRVFGAAVTPAHLAIVRWADAETARVLKEEGEYEKISQLVVALNCTETVGIKGDARVYAFTIVVRAVQSADFMTAEGYQIPKEVRRRITSTLSKHPEIVRVTYDETNKPPATVEFQ